MTMVMPALSTASTEDGTVEPSRHAHEAAHSVATALSVATIGPSARSTQQFPTTARPHIGHREVVADEQQRLPTRDREGIAEAIAGIECRRMPSAPEAERRVTREHHLLLADRHHFGADGAQQAIELYVTGLAVPADHPAQPDHCQSHRCRSPRGEAQGREGPCYSAGGKRPGLDTIAGA
jgi:hypothetical protein